MIALIDQFRKKRNISEYEQAGIASDQEAKEMFLLAKKIRDEVAAQLLKTHPELVKK